jgi:hypothetical protein
MAANLPVLREHRFARISANDAMIALLIGRELSRLPLRSGRS